MMYAIYEMISRNPKFWRIVLMLILLIQLWLLPDFFRGDFGPIEIAVALYCMWLAIRYLAFAHNCVAEQDVLRVQGRRLFISGSVELNTKTGRTPVYAGDIKLVLAAFGAVMVEDAQHAEFCVYLDRATSLIRVEDLAGQHKTFPFSGDDRRSIARPLGQFIARSDTLKHGGVILPLDWSDPRLRRVVFAVALCAQVLLAWQRGFFVWQQPRHVTLIGYFLTVGGLMLTTHWLRRAHQACRMLVPAVRGRKVFVSGSGLNLDGQKVEAADFASLLGAQGAVIVEDRDIAELEIHLAEISAQIKDKQGKQLSTVMDEKMILSELRRMLKIYSLPKRTG
jgi:hypothetical protein